jgi:branched-chain amino acid transport system permease protein
VGAIPGAETIRSEYRGSRGTAVKAFMAALVIGTALFLYNAKFVENVYLWVAITAVLVWVVILIASVALGGINPTFGEAGTAWVGWAQRFGPTALAGYVVGWLIWPIRVDTYSKLWMPLVGAGLALFIRSIVRQIRGSAEKEAAAAAGESDDTAEPSPEPSLAGVN